MAGNREFVNRRLHSLLGVIPIGLFPNAASSSQPFCNRRSGVLQQSGKFYGESTFSHMS